MSADVAAVIDKLDLVDHHVHAPIDHHTDQAAFELLLSESPFPAPQGTSHLDSQVGFALRRHCAPVLGLGPHAAVDEYWDARRTLAPEELARRFLRATGVGSWLVDTGHGGDELMDLGQMSACAAAPTHEVVRLEQIVESVAPGSSAHELGPTVVQAIGAAAVDAVAFKSVAAYRCGLDVAADRPDERTVALAAARWLRAEERAGRAGAPRLEDPDLIRLLLWSAVETGLPLQLHCGFGDPDLDLRRSDPLLLRPWLEAVQGHGAPVMLLHCYPFHRNAGFLAHVYPHVHLDVGLGVNYTGAAAARIVSESLELAPFSKVLFSSDAWGAPELHLLGAVLWRRAMTTVLAEYVAAGEWSLDGAALVARLTGRDNARRVYRLDDV